MQTMVSTAGGVAVAPAGCPEAAGASDPSDSDELSPGAKAGPWRVERELGRGGMGSVYAVTHEEIGKRAALKVMHRRLVSGSAAERILLEARVVNQVGHPNIVDIFETGTLADGRPYIVMERLEGVPLSFRADEGKILPDQAIAILLQVCDALIAAHACNVVHRDLKLDNVFLTDNPDAPQQPRVKLLDWGIAKVISNDVRHTAEGQLVGTPQYLSPEQARGAVVTPQTDVYSLGVMAYELFLEQLPFEAETSAEIMAMHLRATPPPPSELWPDIPATLEDLLTAMLAKDPEARPTMLTVAHTLEQVRTELEARRHAAPLDDAPVATAGPSRPSLGTPIRRSRAHGAAGLAPTEHATEWPRPAHRRAAPVVAGALAVAASAVLLLFTRSADRADASPSTTTTPLTPVETFPAAWEGPPPPAELHAVADLPPMLGTGDPEDVVSDDGTAAAAEAPRTADVAADAAPSPRASRHKPARRHRATPSRSPARPRPAPALDPDGTLDPYQ